MLSVITASTVESVSIAEVKAQARIDGTEEDDLLAALIGTARQWCEAYVSMPLTGSLVTYKLSLDTFCDPRYYKDGVIYFPVAPVVAMSSDGLSYLPSDGGNSTTWASSNYTFDVLSKPARLAPIYGGVYPDTRCQLNAISIPFTAGSTAADQVPLGCRQAIKMLAAELFKEREHSITGTIIQDVPFGVKALLDPHKWGGYL
jgi:uncharacterized phiE125 gp8 family phage protein